MFFKAAAQQGHHFCIASFNAFGFIIPKFLEKMGLTADEIAKIDIIAKLPPEEDRENKNAYIKEAIDHAINKGFSGKASEVTLIDDTKTNCEAAKNEGYQIIHADKQASHLIELLKNILSNLYNRLDKFVDNIGSEGFNIGKYKEIELIFNAIKSILNIKLEISEVLLTKLADRIKGFVDKANFLEQNMLLDEDKKIMSKLTFAMSTLKGKITPAKEDTHQTPPAVDRIKKPTIGLNVSGSSLFQGFSSPKNAEPTVVRRVAVFNP